MRKTFRIACVMLAGSLVVVAAAEDAERSLAAGSKIKAQAKRSNTPLHWAALAGETAKVNALITAGANIEARNKLDATPLHWAASFSKTATVNALIAAGAETDGRDEFGSTPLHKAAGLGAVTALRDLTAFGRGGLAPALVGLRVWTPLVLADAVELMIASIEEELPRAPRQDREYWPHWVLAMNGKGSADIVNALIAAGAKVGARNKQGKTPLHYAAGMGWTDTVNLLIAAGAKVEGRDPFGRTPLHHAAANGRAELIIALLDSGANAAARTGSGDTAFDFARIYQAKKLRGTDAWRRLRDATPK